MLESFAHREGRLRPEGKAKFFREGAGRVAYTGQARPGHDLYTAVEPFAKSKLGDFQTSLIKADTLGKWGHMSPLWAYGSRFSVETLSTMEGFRVRPKIAYLDQPRSTLKL